MRVRRKGKGWRIDARDFCDRDPEPEAKAALLFRVARIIRRRTHDIGKSGVTVDSLDKEMSKEFFSALVEELGD